MELSPLEKLEALFIRLAGRLAWRRPDRRIVTMLELSLTETDGFRTLLRAAELTSSAGMRAGYLSHAIERARHAELFRTRANALLNRLEASGPAADHLRLAFQRRLPAAHFTESAPGKTHLEAPDELELLAALSVDGRRELERLRTWRALTHGDEETAVLLDRMLEARERQLSYGREALERWSREGHHAAVRRATRKARLRWLWQAWLQFSRRFADLSNALTFGVIYFGLVGPLSVLSRTPPRPTGWQPPEDPSLPDLEAIRRQY